MSSQRIVCSITVHDCLSRAGREPHQPAADSDGTPLPSAFFGDSEPEDGWYPASRQAAEAQGLKVDVFPHSINLTGAGSDLRILVQADPRYQAFISTAETRLVLGSAMKVASLGNILQGKVWAYLDDTRRRSKRQKDLADIARLTEAHPELFASLPARIKDQLA
jgi:hypothetical protein